MRNRVTDFYLTKKWDRRIREYAGRNKLTYDYALQEARILEWQLTEKIKDLRHRENYFLQALRGKLLRDSTTWWETKRVRGETPELEFIDSLVSVRGFDELFYDNLIKNIASLLSDIDDIAMEIFMLRVSTQKRWGQIRKEFPGLSKNKFCGHVQVIKKIVREEVISFKESLI